MMNHKRILSFLLAMVMLFGMMPTAFATETTAPETEITATETETTAPESETTAPAETEAPEAAPAETTAPAACPVCQTVGCTATHVWCETCQKYDCGVDHTASEPTETTAATEESSEPTETTEATTAPAEEEEETVTGPQVGDKVWIKTGSLVYKDADSGKSYQLLGNYEVKIKSIITDENGEAAWYEFEFISLGIGEVVLQMSGYKYVQAENTTEEEPPAETTEPEDETACDCGEDAPENLAQHADSCPRKTYVKTLFENKTAEEIYADWETYDEATQTDLLNMLEAYDAEKFEELKALVEVVEDETGTSTPAIQPSADDLSIDGIPSDADIELPLISGCKVDVLNVVPTTSSNYHSAARGLFDIKIISGGNVWQPSDSVQITVSGVVDNDTYVDEDGEEYGELGFECGIVEVRHYLDDENAIRNAIANGSAKYFSITGISEVFPDETAALAAVDSSKVDTICYTVSSTKNGDVTLNEDGSITFTTDSFSVFQVDALYVTPNSVTSVAEMPVNSVAAIAAASSTSEDEETGDEEGEEGEEGGVGEQDPDAIVSNPYVVTNKTVHYDAANEIYKLILESYLNGSPTTVSEAKVASDIVLVLDQSGSMNYCFYCGATDALKKSNHITYAPQVNTSTAYWADKTKGTRLYYCSTCKAWFSNSSHSKHAGSEGYMPVQSAEDRVYDAHVFYVKNGSTYTAVVADDLDLSGNTQYYRGTDKNKVYYCELCERWYNGTHAHNNDGSISAAGTQYYPEISTDFQVTYQPFYSACSEREAALREALNRFVEEVEAASIGGEGAEDDVKNRLALVGFGSDVSSANDTPASNEILTVKAMGYNNKYYPVWYSLIDTESEREAATGKKYLQSALCDVTTTAGQEMVDYALSEYIVKGNTWTDYGMKMAYWILQNATDVDANNDGKADKRNKVVILFTDGIPYRKSTDTTTYGHFGKTANEAIEYSNYLKNNLGATVYGIGIFSNADGSLPAPTNSGANNGSNYAKANRFMHLVSSNYPNATALNNGKEGDVNSSLLEGESYYLSPSTTDELSEVFSQIASTITKGGAYIEELDEKTIVQDEISEHFKIPAGGTVKAYTKSFAGMVDNKATWITSSDELTSEGETPDLTISQNGDIVQVTGFDFAENYVATDMDVDEEIPRGKKLVLEIQIEPSQAATTNLPTNAQKNSGVYYPILDDSGVATGEMTTYENFALPHVDVMTEVTVKKVLENAVADDTSYNINLAYQKFTEYEGNDGSNGNYLKSVNPASETKELSLKHNDSWTEEKLIVGSDFTITEENTQNYEVKISLDGGITWSEPLVADSNGTVSYTAKAIYGMEIVVSNRLLITDITITKTVNGVTPDVDQAENQTFVFHVKGADNNTKDVDMTVVINIAPNDVKNGVGSGSVTIKGVPIGKYTVTEEPGWSWRYDAERGTVTKTITANIDDNYFAFVNNRNRIYWLSGDNYKWNLFNKVTE